jgi:hypothetical protein
MHGDTERDLDRSPTLLTEGAVGSMHVVVDSPVLDEHQGEAHGRFHRRLGFEQLSRVQQTSAVPRPWRHPTMHAYGRPGSADGNHDGGRGTMVADAQVRELVEGYRRAPEAVDLIESRIEREVAQTALRQNASSTLRHISTRAVGVTEATISPLRQWVADYIGGVTAEKVVSQLEAISQKAAQRVLKETVSWALVGNTPVVGAGTFGIVAGIILGIVDFGQDVGQAVLSAFAAGAIPSGAVYFALRTSSQAGPAVAEAVRTTWEDASLLGTNTERVLSETALPVERAVWKAVGGAAHPGIPFTVKAREWAKTVVGGAIGIAAVGIALFLFGVYLAYEEWSSAQLSGILIWWCDSGATNVSLYLCA